jgi:exonuclease SbcC
VLGYEKLRTAQELVREHRKLVTAQISGLRSGMRDPEAGARFVGEATAASAEAAANFGEAENHRLQSEENLRALTPRWEGAQLERDRLQELLAELRVAENEEAGLRRELERVTRELSEVASAHAELDRLAEVLKPLAVLEGEFDRLEALARLDGRRRALLEAVRLVEEELLRLRERFARVEMAPALEEEASNALETARKELLETEGLLEARRTEWVRDRQEAETRRQALRNQYTELRDQRERLAALGDEGNCPTCMRPLRETYRTVLEMLDSQLETVMVDGNYFKARLEQLDEMPEEVRSLDERRRMAFSDMGTVERRLASVQHEVQQKQQLTREIASKEERLGIQRDEIAGIPGDYNPERHETLRVELEKLAPLEPMAARLNALLEKEPQLRDEQAQAQKQLASVAALLESLRGRRTAAGFVEKEFVALRTAHEFAASQLHQAEVAAATAQSEAVAAQQQLDAAQRERTELMRAEAELGSLTLQRRMHEELDRTFTDLRTDLNFQLRPELSELASSFLRDLTDGRYTELELDDAYRIVVLEDGIPKPVISGGEEDLANLSLRLAISQMIAERSGQTFSLLVLDEVFGSLDDARRRSVVDLLRRVRDRFEQVILITHVESVKEGIDQVISVSYDEDSGAAVVENVESQGHNVYADPAHFAEAGAGDVGPGGGVVL